MPPARDPKLRRAADEVSGRVQFLGAEGVNLQMLEATSACDIRRGTGLSDARATADQNHH
jgi:hypothetical protein